jgi:hypothetical protein
MKTALVIVNGLKLPYFLTDRSIAWAKQEGGSLQALFLSSGKEMPEGYIYPSDINSAQEITDERDAEIESLKILHDEMKLFKSMLKAAGVTGGAEMLNDPTLEEVLDKAAGYELLFIAPGYGETSQLAITRFSMQDLIDEAPCAVEVVNEKAS